MAPKQAPDIPSPLKRISALIGLLGGVVALTLGSWQISNRVQEARATRQAVKTHLSVGDRFAAQMLHDQAIGAYEKVVAIDNSNLEVHRKIIASTRDRLQAGAFGDGRALDIALSSDYARFKPVPDTAIDAALNRIYELQTRAPELKDDVELLLDEALILKTDGSRARQAIRVLEQARTLSPDQPLVLAELGLLRAVTSDALQQRVDGLGMIRRALELRPGEARYHFYLARSLAETFRCSHAGAGPRAAGEADACAEAIRSYHRAAELATADDYWSQHIRRWAPHRSLEIFHRYARREGDILTAALNMSLEERTRELEYLVPRDAYRDRSGAHDYPQFWLATLYHSAGDLENAERWIRELLGPDKASWPDGGPWRELYARILEERGPGSERAARNESCPAPCP